MSTLTSDLSEWVPATQRLLPTGRSSGGLLRVCFPVQQLSWEILAVPFFGGAKAGEGGKPALTWGLVSYPAFHLPQHVLAGWSQRLAFGRAVHACVQSTGALVWDLGFSTHHYQISESVALAVTDFPQEG